MMACLEQQVPVATFAFHKAAADHLNDFMSDNYGAMERMGCHLAAEMYKAAGLTVTPEYCVFDQLRKVANWNPALDKFVNPVYRAINNAVMGEHSKDAADMELIKKAMVANVLGLLGKAVTSTPTMAKTLVAGGAATGAGLGALYWALNRHSTEDDDKLEAMKAKIKLYRRITSEISEDMKRNNTLPPELSRNIIKEDAGTNNII
jgi:hypothetical protein